MKQPGRASFVPEGWPTVIPRIVVHNAGELVDFVKQVFGATGDYQEDRPALIKIGDSIIMISGAGVRVPMVAFLYVYVPDVDAVYRRAIDAGVCSIEPPEEMPYGDRRCMVEDRWGNTWQIATYQG